MNMSMEDDYTNLVNYGLVLQIPLEKISDLLNYIKGLEDTKIIFQHKDHRYLYIRIKE